jgi:hypothetical protein
LMWRELPWGKWGASRVAECLMQATTGTLFFVYHTGVLAAGDIAHARGPISANARLRMVQAAYEKEEQWQRTRAIEYLTGKVK